MSKWFKALGLTAFLLFATNTASAVDGYSNYNACCCSPFEGIYIGGNIGASGWENHRNDVGGYILNDRGGYSSHDINFTAGVLLGYDWRWCGSKVLGIVADWNWVDGDTRTELSSAQITAQTTAKFAFHDRMHWFTTIRARAGLTVCDGLVYVTAGAAVADFRTRITNSITGSFNEEFRFRHHRWGWTAGAGVEFSLCGCWSVSAEWLYLIFDKHTDSFSTPRVPGTTFRWEHSDSAWVGRICLNYRFGNLCSGLFGL